METVLRPGYFHLLGFCLVLTMTVSTGCQMFEKPYIAEEGITLPDGTTPAAGDVIYLDKNGQATLAKVDPDTGEENEVFMVPDVEKIEDYKKKGEGLANSLPPPFNGIAGLIVSIAGAGGVAGLRKLREKKLADAGIKKKKS